MTKGIFIKVIGKELLAWSIIVSTIFFLAEQLTSWFMATSLGKFVLNINDDFGWVILGISLVWAISSLCGVYIKYNKPLFIVGALGLLIYYFGTIEVSTEIYGAYYILLTPYLIRHINIIVIRIWHRSFLEWISIGIENLFEKCDSYWKKHPNASFFKYDRFDEKDKLHVGRDQMVNIIVDQVKKLSHNESSFTIGLEGGWGSGKTTLLNKIKSELKGTTDAHGMTVEVVEFSPWAYPDGKSLSVEFLYELRDVLNKHSFKARFVINAYINALAEKSTNLVQLFTSLFFPRESLQKVKDKLADLLRFHRIKLVVIIDDLDRLDAEEMAEVFKMLRNTGDLPNAVYLVAYDRMHVETIDPLKQKDKQEECRGRYGHGYLDKVINVAVRINGYDNGSLFAEFVQEATLLFNSRSIFYSDDLNLIYSLKEKKDLISGMNTKRDKTILLNSISYRLILLESLIGPDLFVKLNPNLIVCIEIIKQFDSHLYSEIEKKDFYKYLDMDRADKQNSKYVGFFLQFFGITIDDQLLDSHWQRFPIVSKDTIGYYLVQETEEVIILNKLNGMFEPNGSFNRSIVKNVIENAIFEKGEEIKQIRIELVRKELLLIFLTKAKNNPEKLWNLIDAIYFAQLTYNLLDNDSELRKQIFQSIIKDKTHLDQIIRSIDDCRKFGGNCFEHDRILTDILKKLLVGNFIQKHLDEFVLLKNLQEERLESLYKSGLFEEAENFIKCCIENKENDNYIISKKARQLEEQYLPNRYN